MSKISIVSRDDQALLIDISGCSNFREAIEQLSSTFLSANHFWEEQSLDLNLGSLLLSKNQASQMMALINGVGAKAAKVFARSASTFAVLEDLGIAVSKEPVEVPLTVSIVKEPSSEQVDLLKAETSVSLKQQLNTATVVASEQVKDSEIIGSPEKKLEKTGTELETSHEVLHEAKVENVSEIKKRNPLYLKQTLRAGQAVTHKGDLIIIGDVNAGAEVMAEGDITIWGSLRGIAHAGINGDTKAEIRALRLQAIQVRIANYIARCPDNRTAGPYQNSQSTAEIARLVKDKIRIVHKTLDG